ncbi:MAG: hypothetical protein WBZ33_03425, partial [Thermoactinomyces sp.]
VINYHYHDVGLTGLRKGEFGWLIRVEEGGKVRPAGLIEFPPPPDIRKAVWSIAEQGKIGEDKRLSDRAKSGLFPSCQALDERDFISPVLPLIDKKKVEAVVDGKTDLDTGKIT